MSGFAIEKGIPFPNMKSEEVYPFNEMEVGDSFLVPDVDAKEFRRSLSGKTRIGIPKGNKTNKIFKSLAEGSGVRVWRIS